MTTQEVTASQIGDVLRVAPARVTPRTFSWRALVAPTLAFSVVAAYFVIRTLLQVVPEGDATLHLYMMETIANGHLPRVIPHFAAIVSPGGEIEAYFPYSYTPLYHLVGAGFFKIGGESAVLMMGPLCAGAIAVGIVYLLRPHPWPAIALAIALIFLHWLTQPIMTWVFMEPMMIAFYVGGLAFYQRSWSERSRRHALLAGLCFGLAVATRQAALLYVAFVAVHAGSSLAIEAWRGARRDVVRAVFGHHACMFAVAALVSLPFLLYLVSMTGTVGYGQFALPGLAPHLTADPEANGYLSSISTPDASAVDWLRGFWSATLYVTRWQPPVINYLPIVLFVAGMVFLVRRGDRSSLFLATYTPVHLLCEMTQYMTIHGNWRYIVGSRVLFYAVVGLGIWWVVTCTYRFVSQRLTPGSMAAGAVSGALVIAAIAPMFVTPGLVDYLVHQEESRTEKGRAYRELGAFVQEHVPEDALILSGRWYSSGWYLRRDYTWITYFGNNWVIDAIGTRSPEAAREVLRRYGVDYVVIQSPPPAYVDQMPADGLRQVLLDDLDHFQLLFRNERVRLYRFWPDGVPTRGIQAGAQG
ncbi:MAG: hypothetical protein WBD55_04010 [Dehalococcoidia bacterium]